MTIPTDDDLQTMTLVHRDHVVGFSVVGHVGQAV